MIFLNQFSGGGEDDPQTVLDKMYEWSDQAFYHLALITSYKSGLGATELSQQGFGRLGSAPVETTEAQGDSDITQNPGTQGDGLRPTAYFARGVIRQKFGVRDIGGFSRRNIAGTSHLSDHALGLALDVMVYYDKSLGQRVADYVVANAQQLKVKYVIWYNQIYTTTGGRSGYWRPYHSRGGDSRTLRHEDHVHISFFP